MREPDDTGLPEETPSALADSHEPVMIPVRLPDSRSYVAYGLLGICILAYLLQLASQSLLGFDLLVALGVKVNEWIMQGQYWRLFTPMFLHASIIHIGFNMYALHNLGPGLERFYKHGRFLTLYLLAGFAGNVVSFMASDAASLGSSTAIFGLLGAQGVFLYQNKRIFGERAKRALSQVLSFAVINFLIGLSPGIDNWGHLGGLLGGVAFAWFAGPVLDIAWEDGQGRLVDQRSDRRAVWVALGIGGFFVLAAVLGGYLWAARS